MYKKKNNDWWWAIAAYMGLLYSTSGLAAQIWNAFDSSLKGLGPLLVYITAFVVAVFAALYVLRFRKDREYLHYVLLIGSFSILWFMVVHTDYAVDKIHLIEYGVLGALVYKAVIHHFRSGAVVFILGSLICIVLGSLDEVVQYFVPGRYFDPKDIVMNGVSSVLTLLVMIICFKTKDEEESYEQYV